MGQSTEAEHGAACFERVTSGKYPVFGDAMYTQASTQSRTSLALVVKGKGVSMPLFTALLCSCHYRSHAGSYQQGTGSMNLSYAIAVDTTIRTAHHTARLGIMSDFEVA